jgi:hypothetical protein
LKDQSNILPLYYSTDHKIELIEDNTLEFYYLNKQSIKELTAIQDYLNNNLDKGFIIKSKVPFTSLVLFIYKAD